MRTIIAEDPQIDLSRYLHESPTWKATWVAHPDHRGPRPVVLAFRNRFSLPKAAKVRVHVTADERYELFVDGLRVGRGSERGDLLNWFYETYDLDLPAGEHVIVARVWWVGPEMPSAYAQFSVRPAFFLRAEGDQQDALSTGLDRWEVKELGGYTFTPTRLPRTFIVVGPKVDIDGSKVDWGVESGAGDGWRPVATVGKADVGSLVGEANPWWVLRPAILPPMLDEPVKAGVARHIDQPPSAETLTYPVRSDNNLADELPAWNAMLKGTSPLTIPANTARRVIIDLDNYYCAYPDLTTTGGKGSIVRVHWAESLYEKPEGHVKGHRDQIEGKLFRGIGDTFRPDGGQHRAFSTLWWEAGRYLEVYLTTANEPLTIESLTLRETHYPYHFTSRFESSDKKLDAITPLALRTLEMCSHETYMDCPYYEQLMYVGDTRLEVLTTYATTPDDRLPRKALLMFDVSRVNSGLTQARYPSRVIQVIAPFSLWYVGMLHDFMMWRDDRGFVAARADTVRTVLEAYRRHVNDEGLVVSPRGWNVFDWVPEWPQGIPPDAHTGVSSIVNFLTVLALRYAAEIEEFLGEPLLAQRHRDTADRIGQAAERAFWDEKRGMYADERSRRHWSEHAQILALLSGSIPDAKRDRVLDGLFTAADLSRTTIYFSHYYLEACRLTGRMDKYFERLAIWYGLRERGFRTTVESPEPSRSDCHAWGAHPVFHDYASLLGIRPASPGFITVRIEPQLGPLEHARGTMTHPRGQIEVAVRKQGEQLVGHVTLPAGVTGTLVRGQQTRVLKPGRQELRI